MGDEVIGFKDGEVYLLRHSSWTEWFPFTFERRSCGLRHADGTFVSLIWAVSKRSGYEVKEQAHGH